MRRNIIKFLRNAFPFLITVALWRLALPWVNPAGLLAIIPIFYCSFISVRPYFVPFAILFCFLLDYSFGTVFVWTLCYCTYYAAMNIQTILDLTHTKENGLFAFMVFFGAVIFLISIQDLNLLNFGAGILTFIITCALYIPITKLIRVVKND
jgi:hypothetical protein